MWQVYAVLSALFAALVAILAKIGIQGIDTHLAVAVRTLVVVVMAWGIFFARSSPTALGTLSAKNWTFLILSGLATGLSWLCYYRALAEGPVSKVAPLDKLSVPLTLLLAFLVLHEPPQWNVIFGGILIFTGSLLMLR